MQDTKLVLEVSFVLCVSYSRGRNRTGTAGALGFCTGKIFDCMEIYSYGFMHVTC